MNTANVNSQGRFWRRWAIANGLGELVGLGLAACLGWISLSAFGTPSRPATVLMFAAFAILLGALEGAVVGLAQERVLRQRLPQLRGWTRATIIGAVVAWALGMVPSTVMNLREATSSQPPPEVSPWLTILAASGLGFLAGPILAAFQVRALRRHVDRAGWWVFANALAWAVGMPIIFAGIDLAHAHPGLSSVPLILGCTLFLAGATVGSIHGLFLVRLTTAGASSA